MHDNLISKILNFKNKKIDPSIIDQNQVEKIIFYLLDSIKENIDGDVVEFGCYVGESGKYIMKTLLETKSNKKYYVYDSFEGLPDLSIWEKNTGWRPGTLNTTESVLIENFQRNGLPIPVIHKDWFCDVPSEKIPEKICFAFLDGDFYQSIYDSLSKIYDKVVDGGYILFHDYDRPDLPGVRAAIKDYFDERGIEFTVVETAHQLGVFRKNMDLPFDKSKNIVSSELTFVSGLWDIETNEDPSKEYFDNQDFIDLLSIDNNLILFGSEKLRDFVMSIRNTSNTQFIVRNFDWFETNEFYKKILESHSNEHSTVDLNFIVHLLKIFLFHDAKILDKFNSNIMFWIDPKTINQYELQKLEKYNPNFLQYQKEYVLIATNTENSNTISISNTVNNNKIMSSLFGGNKDFISTLNYYYYLFLSQSLTDLKTSDPERLFSLFYSTNSQHNIFGKVEFLKNIVKVELSGENQTELMKINKVLVTSICFVDFNKKNYTDYIYSAHKLIHNIISNTNYDLRIITNSPKDFDVYTKSSVGYRIEVTYDDLKNDKLVVGRFNQLLKYKVFLNIPNTYDWVLYLDCDAGIDEVIDEHIIDVTLEKYSNSGHDFLGTRTDFTVGGELKKHEECVERQISKRGFFEPWGEDYNLFSPKFVYYNLNSNNMDPSWLDASLPDEHMMLFKNSDKCVKLGNKLMEFCREYEKQVGNEILTISNEAFEIGISAKIAGFNVANMEDHDLDKKIKVVYNLNSIGKKQI